MPRCLNTRELVGSKPSINIAVFRNDAARSPRHTTRLTTVLRDLLEMIFSTRHNKEPLYVYAGTYHSKASTYSLKTSGALWNPLARNLGPQLTTTAV